NSATVGTAQSASNPSASFIISGNGAGTDNYIGATLAKVTTVDQYNTAYITTDVDADASTGKNDAGFNTGGEVVIATGDAKVLADVDNSVNFNFADVDCGCTWDVLAKIAGNGADPDHHEWWWWDDPDNTITLNLDSIQAVGQGNGSYLYTQLDDLNAKTGHNKVESNTADPEGDPIIITGDALIESGVENSGNVNTVGDFTPFLMPEWPDFDFSFDMSAMWAFFGMNA
ncbi:hypothetical protein HY468_00910, partial [Candidatus Roizmanbacteria bacterium]|nr:hypothetical protein [Candidatus Roizmanbacteria bacterium]